MRWMWIDQVVHHEPRHRLVTIKNVSLAEEHLHDHLPPDEHHAAPLPLMPASLMIEGMAQTAGILVGTMTDFKEKVVLAKVALARLDADVIPGQTIRYDATIDRYDAVGASTTGVIQRMKHAAPDASPNEWETIGEVNLMFSQLDQNMAGTVFPEHNFVFDAFDEFLESQGLLASS